MSSPELELEEARQIKEFNERARTRSSTIKRRDGLLKKAEQLRRLGNIDVALCLFDPVSDEYWVYRSRDDDNWPPSIESMKKFTKMNHFSPSDFESAKRIETTIAEDECTGKKRRKLPDICLKRKKQKRTRSISENRLDITSQHNPSTEESREASSSPAGIRQSGNRSSLQLGTPNQGFKDSHGGNASSPNALQTSPYSFTKLLDHTSPKNTLCDLPSLTSPTSPQISTFHLSSSSHIIPTPNSLSSVPAAAPTYRSIFDSSPPTPLVPPPNPSPLMPLVPTPNPSPLIPSVASRIPLIVPKLNSFWRTRAS